MGTSCCNDNKSKNLDGNLDTQPLVISKNISVQDKENKAAITIQSRFKGYQVRKKLDAERTKDAPKEADAEALEQFPYDEFASDEMKSAKQKLGTYNFNNQAGKVEWGKLTAYRFKASGNIYIG